MTKEQLINEFNALNIHDMDKVSDLNELPGEFINLQYRLPSGQDIKIWNDSKTYWGNELCKKNSERCYGLAAGDGYLMVCEYGEAGKDAELVILKKID